MSQMMAAFFASYGVSLHGLDLSHWFLLYSGIGVASLMTYTVIFGLRFSDFRR